MHKSIRSRLAALTLGVAALALSGWVLADPPTRVARLGYISGAVSFSPAGENEWVHGTINRPLTSGDRLWITPGARAEMQVGFSSLRMSGSTSMTLLNIDDRVTQVELSQGTLNIRVRRLPTNQVFEVNTPNLAFTVRRPGNYRIEVDPRDDATTIFVRDGAAEVYGEGAAYTVAARRSYRYYGTGLLDYELVRQPRTDEFDRWSIERDRRAERSVSLRYVSADVIGYEDLDAYGTWRTYSDYGSVWVPSRVDAGWAPFRDGHWSWVEPWGWTWVDDAPWGFAVSHYGRWANISGTWGWVPGPVRQQAVYAPALVAFVGGSNFQLSISTGNVGGVAWFPLGPRDVYRPSYQVSREYFTRVNVSNTVINTTNITNVYNNTSTNITYVNQRVPGAVVAVPATTFVQSQPVARAAVRINTEQIATAPVQAVAAFAPVQRSVIGGTATVAKPAIAAAERPVVARSAPPPPPVAFAVRESALAATPGKPLAPAEVQRLKPGAPAVPAPQVIIAAPAKAAVPMTSAQPSKPAPAARGEAGPAGQRGRQDQAAPPSDTSVKQQPGAQPAPAAPIVAPAPDTRQPPGQRGRTEAPATQAPDATAKPAPAGTPAVVAPVDSRTAPGQRGRAEPTPQATPPAVVAPPVAPAAKPQPAPPPPAAAPADQRPAPGQRGRQEQTTPQAATPAIVAPPVAPAARPQSAPQPPAAAPAEQRQPPGQRGRQEQPKAQPEPQPAPPAAKAQPAPQAAPQPAPPAARAQPAPQAAPQPSPPAARPQPAPQAVPQPPAAAPVEPRAAPVEQRATPAPRGRPEPQAQPAAPPPAQAGRPPAQRQPQPEPSVQTNPNAPPAAAPAQRGPGAKPGASKAEDKRTPEEIKRDEQLQKDDEKKGRRPN